MVQCQKVFGDTQSEEADWHHDSAPQQEHRGWGHWRRPSPYLRSEW